MMPRLRSATLLLAAALFSLGAVPAPEKGGAIPAPEKGGAAPTPEAERFVPSKKLAELLAARRKDGEPVIGREESDYFDSLPSAAKKLFNQAVENGLMTEPEHLRQILSLRLSPGKVELFMRDNCALCHTDPAAQDPETLFSLDPKAAGSPAHLNLLEFVNDVHFRRDLSCAGCHGGKPTDEDMVDEISERWPKPRQRHKDRTWIPEFCARCHADPGFMRRFNPNLPTDQYAKYRESRHGILLLREKDSKAAQCVSCHGVHGIRSPKSPRSKVHAQQVPYTCGACHADAKYMAGYFLPDGRPLPTNQLEAFKSSVHGRALLEKGDLGAPACNDCHGAHAALPPEIASIAEVCRSCHAANGELFDGSKHKEAFERHGWPECAKCHGNHAIAKTEDAMLSEKHSTLCYECHRENAKDNDKCTPTAEHFYASITTLASETHSLAELVPELAERGLDVEGLSSTVGELEDVLKEARSRIHAFERSEFDPVVTRGREAIEKGRQLVHEDEAEYRFRNRGLLASLAVMGLLAVLMYLKIRQIESRDRQKNSSTTDQVKR